MSQKRDIANRSASVRRAYEPVCSVLVFIGIGVTVTTTGFQYMDAGGDRVSSACTDPNNQAGILAP